MCSVSAVPSLSRQWSAMCTRQSAEKVAAVSSTLCAGGPENLIKCPENPVFDADGLLMGQMLAALGVDPRRALLLALIRPPGGEASACAFSSPTTLRTSSAAASRRSPAG